MAANCMVSNAVRARDFDGDEWVDDELDDANDANEDSRVDEPLEPIESVLIDERLVSGSLVRAGRSSFLRRLIAFRQLSISCVISKNVFTRSDKSRNR